MCETIDRRMRLPFSTYTGVAILACIVVALISTVFRSAPTIAPEKPVQTVRVAPREPANLARMPPAPVTPAFAPKVAPGDVTGSIARDTVAPDQAFPAAACGEDDECLRQWYDEYKRVVLDELQIWRGFEDDVAADNRSAAVVDLKRVDEKKTDKHQRFDFYRGVKIDGVKRDDFVALIDDCRAAIINMKFMLATLARDMPMDDGNPGHYLRNVRNCEKQFKIAPVRSALRRMAPRIADQQ